MRMLGGIIAGLCLAAAGMVGAEEPQRTWTNAAGKKVEGTLKGKTQTHAEVMLATGKVVKMELATLSEADRSYVAGADVHPDPVVKAKTVTAKGGAADEYKGTSQDAREVEVELTRIHGRKYKVVVLWLGDGGDKEYGIYKAQELEVSEDGVQKFKTIYDTTRVKADLGDNYRGYVVGLMEPDKAGWIVRMASQKPFERFLDEDWKAKLKVK